MSYNEKADNIAQLTIECESCSEIITLVSGSGRYFTVRINEIFLFEGEIRVNVQKGKMVCADCLNKSIHNI